VEVRPVRRNALAMRWLTETARKRGEKSMVNVWQLNCWKQQKTVFSGQET
jgi:ribosomal protein S7